MIPFFEQDFDKLEAKLFPKKKIPKWLRNASPPVLRAYGF
jgi:hypothetical protein